MSLPLENARRHRNGTPIPAVRIARVIDDAILAAIGGRLSGALEAPAVRYRRFEVDGMVVGLVDDTRAERLAQFDSFQVTGNAVRLDRRLATPDLRSSAIADVAALLRSEGALPGWRDERFTVAPQFGLPPVLTIERGAARYFGVLTFAAHVNGVLRRNGEARMWLARRSPDKAVDPGLLDNLVGGGIAAGCRVDRTLVKEAWEEAGIPASLAARARPAGIVHSRKPVIDGLQREIVFVHDLALPDDFIPANQDGEAVAHRSVTMAQAAYAIAATAGPDEVTLDASLVVLDYLIRCGEIRPDQARYVELAALTRRGV